jgi:hypothetical protein
VNANTNNMILNFDNNWKLKDCSFFDKEYILISRRYQLHSVSATISALMAIRMHTAKNKEKELQ